MATRALVGILNESGTVDFIYNHWDGYPEHLGVMLKNYYNTEENIRELLSLGDASGIDSTLAKSEFYARDRGEDLADVSAKTKSSLVDFSDYADNVGAEWIYCWFATDDGHSAWHVAKPHRPFHKL